MDWMLALHKLRRRLRIMAMERIDASALLRAGAERVVKQFRRVARRVPAYAAILEAHGVSPDRVRTPAEFVALCPILDKSDLFGSFPIDQLCVGGQLGSLAALCTSSGQGGRFAFGLTTHRQAARAAKAIESAMEYSFGTDRYSTLLINALPMGVRFSCSTVTIAETSVREDMVCALVDRFSPHYDQTILVTDPLFCKRILDQGRESGLDWGRFKVHVILGEESFGEAFRHYIASRLGQDPEGWTRGLAMSSMGVGEIGLNLFFETRETIRLRQLAHQRPQAMRQALGNWPGGAPPLLFVYDPRQIFVEVIAPRSNGYGSLTLSTLDKRLPLPLMRYRTGDQASLVDAEQISRALDRGRFGDFEIPRLPMIAITGREKDLLPDGRTLLDIKDAIYTEPHLADQLSGAFRVEIDGADCRLHFQMCATCDYPECDLVAELGECLPAPSSGMRHKIKIWKHAEFPFARTLDYERKFHYFDPAPRP
jgi:phenylacetate-CoA ligase